MKVPQSQSPSAPLRLWDIAAHWDVVARRHGAAGLRGCGRHGRVTSGPWDCGTAGLRGRGAVGHRGCRIMGSRCTETGRGRPGAASEACGRVVVGCRRGRILGAPTAPWGCGAVGHRDVGTMGLWDCGTVGLRDSAVGAFPDPSPRSRAKGGPAPGSGRGARAVDTPDAPRRTAPTRARRPKAVTM